MIEGLRDDLCRIVTLYKNRLDYLAWNGRETTFSMKDVVRHFLFTKAESCGFTPVPNVKTLWWTLDLVCLRQLHLEQVYFIRASKKEDYRGLLLFPRSVEKILIVLSGNLIPDGVEGLTIIQAASRMAPDTGAALTVPYAIQCYCEAHNEVFGFAPLFPNHQLVSSAARCAMFWFTHGKGLVFKEYMVWACQKWNARPNVEASSPHLSALLTREAFAMFRLERRRASYDSGWTERGWGSLGSNSGKAVHDDNEGGIPPADTGLDGDASQYPS